MEKESVNMPSGNNLKSVHSHTDRSYDATNELRGDRQFAAAFASDMAPTDMAPTDETETFKNPYERENPNAQNKNKTGMLLGSREDSLEIEDETQISKPKNQ